MNSMNNHDADCECGPQDRGALWLVAALVAGATLAVCWRRPAGGGGRHGSANEWATGQRLQHVQEVQETRKRLEKLDHDFRTPLGSLATAMELLRTEPADSEIYEEAMSVLERQIARLHSLTDELHELSHELAAPDVAHGARGAVGSGQEDSSRSAA